jgi:hypothetical protein
MASREATLDFARIGASTRALNMIAAFFNADIQGFDKFIRAHREDAFGAGSDPKKPLRKRLWKGTIARGLGLITLPTLLLYLVNRQDQRWRNEPRWMKDRFWYVPLFNDKMPFLLVPKPFLYGTFYASMPERIFEWIDTQDPAAFEDLWATLGSAVPIPKITAAIPVIEWWANKNLYTGKDIEPAHTQRWEAQFRSRPDTAVLSQELSDAANKLGIETSPAKMQNAIIGYTAGVGRIGLAASNLVKPGGIPRPSMKAADVPLVRAFLPRMPNPQSGPFTKLYERVKELDRKIASFKASEENPEGPTRGAKEPTDAEMAEHSILKAAEQRMSGINRDIREIEASKEITPEQKRTQIDALIEERNAIAADAIADSLPAGFSKGSR